MRSRTLILAGAFAVIGLVVGLAWGKLADIPILPIPTKIDRGTSVNTRRRPSLLRKLLLRTYSSVIGYRYPLLTKDGVLDVPGNFDEVTSDRLRDKSRASIAAAGIFLAFSVAVLAAILAAPDVTKRIEQSWNSGPPTIIASALMWVLAYLVIRQERVLSREGDRWVRWRRYIVLHFLLAVATVLFVIGPYAVKSNEHPGAIEAAFSLPGAFPLAGLTLIVTSIFFEVFAVEFYDAAGGWRGGGDEGGRRLRFHLAGMASHSLMLGLCLAVLGIALFCYLISYWIGALITMGAIFALVIMTEIERELWERRQ